MAPRLFLAFGVVGLVLCGCEAKPGSKTPAVASSGLKNEEEEHTHGEGPHKGVVFDLGKYHGEFTVDHHKKECTIYILSGNAKDMIAVACKELTVTTLPAKTGDGKNVPSMTIKLKPVDAAMGKATTFVGTDPGLANEVDYGGTVAGEINGNASTGKFQELPEAPK